MKWVKIMIWFNRWWFCKHIRQKTVLIATRIPPHPGIWTSRYQCASDLRQRTLRSSKRSNPSEPTEMARIFEYFVVCGIGPEIRTLDGTKGYHGVGIMYLPSLLDQFPPPNHSLCPPPPPQLSTVRIFSMSHSSSFSVLFNCSFVDGVSSIITQWFRFLMQCVLPAGVQFHSSGFDWNDPSTSPRSYPIVLTGLLLILQISIRHFFSFGKRVLH